MVCIPSPFVRGTVGGTDSGIMAGQRGSVKSSSLGAPYKPSQEGHQEQNEKYKEKKLGDSSGGHSDTPETENRGDDPDHEKGNNPWKHLYPPRPRLSPLF